MKLIEYFNLFLKNEVNLNESRIALLDARVEVITDFIKSSSAFTSNFVDIIPQGSYAHKTIIRPVQESHEFDVDLLFQLQEVTGWEPKDYVNELYRVFHDSNIYRDKVSRRTRCVVINYNGDFLIDIVPFLERSSGNYITNRNENRFERTDPEGYNSWLEEKNRTANHHFVKTVRLIKYLRDFKGNFTVKSIILNTLLGQQVSDGTLLLDTNYYQDVPTTLRNIMNELSKFVQNNPILPAILDPSGTGEFFNDRWDQSGYSNFRNRVIFYAEKIDQAYLEPDKELSLQKWQMVFGNELIAPKNETRTAIATPISPAGVLNYRNTEQQLSDVGISEQINPRYKVRLSARLQEKRGFRAYELSRSGNDVKSGRIVCFTVTSCNVPQPYQIFWKVKNKGEEARKRDCIRGEIILGSNKKSEPTAFRGPHYVECYIVKDGLCIARDRQDVNIIS